MRHFLFGVLFSRAPSALSGGMPERAMVACLIAQGGASS
jgi:ABC-type glutathione transport system ATPase component